ncbi:ATP-binding protein [Amycolatopsis panacis]|uniref:ATP-binding protein n=1 Tax=Amycolatopsis panacis TaxID=2340917 RepID=A0A419IAX2_9PSEU|nr:ATP-binding protein [Amycolatopsis panacis]RJQ91205.1 ATP-binding protein [Amycolatopsis panacis]
MTTSRMPSRRATVPAPDPLRVVLPADVTAPAVARRRIQAALASIDLPGTLRDDVLLATSELVTNAVEHGERPERLELMLTTEELVVSVFDRGAKIPELQAPSSPAAARSRGLQLVHALSIRWGYNPAEGGKCVWAAFAL